MGAGESGTGAGWSYPLIRLTLDNGDRWTFPADRILDIYDRTPKAQTTLVRVAVLYQSGIGRNVLETPDEIRRMLNNDRNNED